METVRKELNKLNETVAFLLERDLVDEAYAVYQRMDAEFAALINRIFYTDERGVKHDVTHIFKGVGYYALKERKVGYIKQLREFTRETGPVTGLKKAKEYVEWLINKASI